MSDAATWGAFAVAAYLSGSIPFGLIAGRVKGVDLREVGSKNIGASNAGRVLGKQWFVIILVLDALKGFVPVLLTGLWLQRTGAFVAADDLIWQRCAWLAVALAAILGHLFSVFLGFRGGRGVATSLGVVLAIWPYYTIPGALAFVVWGVVKKASGYISVASMTAAIAFPVLMVSVSLLAGWRLRPLGPPLGFAVVVALLIVVRHWPNIRRLRAGQELSPDQAEAPGEALSGEND